MITKIKFILTEMIPLHLYSQLQMKMISVTIVIPTDKGSNKINLEQMIITNTLF